MCMQASLVNDVVSEYVSDNMLFTAYDVTKEVRNRTRDRVIHDEVKREVHKLFNNGSMFSYNRGLVNLPNVQVQPWVYHPLSADVNDYQGQPVSVNQNQPATQALSAPPAGNSLSSGTPAPAPVANSLSATPSDNYELDSTNRLCVPARLVRQAGWANGDEVLVLSDPNTNEMVLTTDQNRASALYPITTYSVDSYDNIRITLAALQKAGINGAKFDIQGDASGVTVKKAA